jgi:hypothetical protein
VGAIAGPAVGNGNALAEPGAAQFLSGDQVVQHIIVGQGRLIFTDNPGDGFK